MNIRSFLSTLFCLLFIQSFAQESAVEMADSMRSNGKIYVVVGVLLAIFTGIIIYLIRLDRKISAMEKNRK